MTTSNIILVMENGVVRANEKTVPTSWQPNKLAGPETIPNLVNSVVSVIENSTVPSATIIISHEETIANHAPSVT